ncbi:tryptophan synthase subunit alpha [Anaerosporomusa subterranea]|uniref:Tryptophan synthase alpha chain n=1 Tax=Anaerosporomusa subterranea TaxID=1794912 RepID=A0A154BPE0_ANASB|nr:tryptophan synthase subunit alpha [Anaerosporomusa subterranea]KYZ75857.1 tryptophan synthase subunit alpha [Anaerosporomusa subterranea]
MQNRKSAIGATFQKLQQSGNKALITYISAGDPDLNTTRKLVLSMAANGVDIIELGIPYSDPIADGPVIQQASLRALQNGVSIEAIFGLIASLRQDTQIPLVLMAYYNSLLQYGIEKFISTCAAVGVDGLIIPDLPLEESEELRQQGDAQGINVILLIAPTTPTERIARIAEASRGFLYCVSVAGVTGAQSTVDSGLQKFLARVRSQTELPLAVGFGISTPDQAAAIAVLADGVIVGSAVITVLEQYLGTEMLISKVGEFAKSLKNAIR